MRNVPYKVRVGPTLRKGLNNSNFYLWGEDK